MQKPNYKIIIHPQRRGYNMYIGCELLCYGDSENEMEEMMSDLLLYFDDPERVREKYSLGDMHPNNCRTPSQKKVF